MRMLARAMPWNHYDSKIDREWSQVKRRQRRVEQRDLERQAEEASGDRWFERLFGCDDE